MYTTSNWELPIPNTDSQPRRKGEKHPNNRLLGTSDRCQLTRCGFLDERIIANALIDQLPDV